MCAGVNLLAYVETGHIYRLEGPSERVRGENKLSMGRVERFGCICECVRSRRDEEEYEGGIL